MSQNSAFNLALRSSSTFNAFQAAVAAGINGFSSPLQTPPVQSPLTLYTRFNERFEESSDYSSTTTTTTTNTANDHDNNNMDLINPYMRHHSFAAAASAQQNNSPSVNLLNRSPPLHHHHHHQNHLGNGFPDSSQMDYQSQILDYHSAAAAAAYAANNNNHLSSPLMLLKNNNNNLDKLQTDCKSPRSNEDSLTPPPLLSTNDNNNTNNSQTSSRLQSESPDNCHNSLQQRSRYDNNSSPGVDSSKSFSVSQRSSEEAGNNSESSPPPSDYSPENLSSRKFTSTNSGHPLGIHNNNNISLDHKLPLSFLGPPLAALHSMTEMKSGNIANSAALNGSYASVQNSHMISENRVNSSGSIAGSTNTHTQGTANPHGIDTILSKPPPPVTSAGLSALTGGK